MPSASHHRRSIRVSGFDYTHPGPYFITIVTHGRVLRFGGITGNEMRLNQLGQIVQIELLRLPERFPGLLLEDCVIMPNHLHGLLFLGEQQGVQNDENKGCKRGSLGAVVRAFKSSTTLRYRLLFGDDAGQLWQRGYYEHIVHGSKDFDYIRAYIQNNPAQWELDQLRLL